MSSPAVTVEQVDRDAAAPHISGAYGPLIAAGKMDDHYLVKAFARHRLAAITALEADKAALVEAAYREGWWEGTREGLIELDWKHSEARAALTKHGDDK